MKLCAQLACLPSATSRMMSLLELAQRTSVRSKTPTRFKSGASGTRRRLRPGALQLDPCARQTLPFSERTCMLTWLLLCSTFNADRSQRRNHEQSEKRRLNETKWQRLHVAHLAMHASSSDKRHVPFVSYASHRSPCPSTVVSQ